MRYIIFTVLVSCGLTSFSRNVLAGEYQSPSHHHTLAVESRDGNFYTQAGELLQRQMDLIVRIEEALVAPDANRLRAVRGQLIIQTRTVAGFLKAQDYSRQGLCNLTDASSVPAQLSKSQIEIACALSASSQQLLKLTPMLDQLLSRRGELSVVRPLPLIGGERQSHPVLSIAPIQHPDLAKVATPLVTREPNLASPQSSTLPMIGGLTKTAIANYAPPTQPAIAPPDTALDILAQAKRQLTVVQVAFPPGIKFTDAQATTIALDGFAYGLDPQEPQTYAKFLQLPHTGIFRVLPAWAYHRPVDTLWNRLKPKVSDRFPFPSLGNTQAGFNPSLTLQVVSDRFKFQDQGIDYSFMVDVGDVGLEKLDHGLKSVDSSTREFFLNYQPPKQLAALPVEKRRFITGKDQNWNQSQTIFASATAKLNHTYLVRSLQFQLPEILLSSQFSTSDKLRYIEQLKQMRTSDMIIAFRPVRRRSDGSYTVLWRVLNQLPAPQIEN